MLLGANRFTGEPLSGPDRVVQDVETTLSTPFFSQPGQRAFGSKLPEMISKPAGEAAVMDLYGALIDAFDWEPEADIRTFQLQDISETGRVALAYSFVFLPTGEVFTRVYDPDDPELTPETNPEALRV
ncbi:hypothetical protein [Roseibium sp.]|uniref:hypothetical protein n=1 Tax=Roseibium sp. TaxID=1936156 RepID=UPI003D125A43